MTKRTYAVSWSTSVNFKEEAVQKELLIAPSVLSADFSDLGSAVSLMEEAGADWAHIDVMDGHFVPNITMGIPLVKSLKPKTRLPLDAHLMVSNPGRQIPWFLEAGADVITFHVEAATAEEAQAAIRAIHEGGANAGIAIKPKTDLACLEPFISDVDMVLVMSVEPGFSGQSFIEGSDARIRRVRKMADEAGTDILIQVDGGIGESTVACVAQAGVDCVVCGNAFFKAFDPLKVPTQLRMQAAGAA